MRRKERDFITLRFRKKLDDDLKEAVKSLEDGMLSNLVRDGLRLMLGIRTTKKIEVIESVLSLPIGLHENNPEIPAQDNKPINETEQQKGAKFPQKPSAPYLSNPNSRN